MWFRPRAGARVQRPGLRERRPCAIGSSRWPSRPSRSPTSTWDRSSITATRSSTASRGRRPKKALDDFMTGLGEDEDRPEEGGSVEAKRPRAVPVLSWQVQEDLFTKKAKFSYRTRSPSSHFLLGGAWRLGWASVGLKDGGAPQDQLGAGGAGNVRHSGLRGRGIHDPRGDAEDVGRSLYLNGEVMSGAGSGSWRARTGRRASRSFIGKPGKLAPRSGGSSGTRLTPGTAQTDLREGPRLP